MRRLVPVIFMLTLLVSSCYKDDTILYSHTFMAEYSAGCLHADNGLIYNIVERECDIIPDTLKRVYVLCDILRESPRGKDEYEIRLRDFVRVLVKDVVPSSSPEEYCRAGSDPISLLLAWPSGPSLNTRVAFTVQEDSKTVHRINLSLDEERSTRDTLFFELRHDASGEFYGSPSISSASSLKSASAFASFPVRHLIPEGQKEIGVDISWHGHAANPDGTLRRETQYNHVTGSLKRQD